MIKTGHTSRNMQDTMEIIQIARKIRHINNIEKYNIICTQKQMSEVLFDRNSLICEAVYNHYITQLQKYFNIRNVNGSTLLT
jgi:hypothetical protein